MNGLKSTPAQRWLARPSFVFAGLAIVILFLQPTSTSAGAMGHGWTGMSDVLSTLPGHSTCDTRWYARDHSLLGRQCYETHVDHFEP